MLQKSWRFSRTLPFTIGSNVTLMESLKVTVVWLLELAYFRKQSRREQGMFYWCICSFLKRVLLTMTLVKDLKMEIIDQFYVKKKKKKTYVHFRISICWRHILQDKISSFNFLTNTLTFSFSKLAQSNKNTTQHVYNMWRLDIKNSSYLNNWHNNKIMRNDICTFTFGLIHRLVL